MAIPERSAEIQPIPRPGSYGILVNGRNELLVVRAQDSFHLPGGGREGDETDIECLKREFLEETGVTVLAAERAGEASEEVISREDGIKYRIDATFYGITVWEKTDQPTDEHTSWCFVPLADAVKALARGIQRDAARAEWERRGYPKGSPDREGIVPWTVSISSLMPSQLYVSSGKLAKVETILDSLEGSGAEIDPVGVRMIEGRLVMLDGHTRAVALCRRGVEELSVYRDPSEWDWEAYGICMKWCDDAGIGSPRDLLSRVVSEADYERLWLDRCRAMQAGTATAKTAG